VFAEDDIGRRRVEREAADRAYNDALTALDRAFPKLPELPHPPVAYDESQLPALNDRWGVLAANPTNNLRGWRRRVALLVWGMVGPVLERQQAFNATLVDHLNRNVEIHRATRAAIEATLGTVRGELEKLEAFHARLILYLQTITLFVDTKDRSEHIATLANLTNEGLSGVADEFRRRSEAMAAREQRYLAALTNLTTVGLGGVADEFRRRWESMVAREQRYVGAVDELRTSIAGVQQTGLMLKRELERNLADGTAAEPAHAAVASAAPVSRAESVNAYKYVGFENKFRGSEADIRSRLLSYVEIFQGASNVLDLGCGRGEFLALLAERGISAHGLDINHEMVEACRARGLDAREGDAMAYIESIPDGSLGGLIAVQVAEHFQPPYLVRFLDTAYHKLKPGSKIVIETLNPSCWFAFFEAYIRDITHAWPLHPETLKFLVVASGFQRIELRLLSPYPGDAKLQHAQLPPEASTLGMVNLALAFNENVDKVNAVMFSFLDYVVVGERI
jgi:O-antigen chain-terminating methyltransferase